MLAWIIALWKAIHGGDPAPETVAAGVIAAVAPYLKSFTEGFTTKQLESGFGTLGVTVTQPSEAELKESAQPQIAAPSIASKFPRQDDLQGTCFL